MRPYVSLGGLTAAKPLSTRQTRSGSATLYRNRSEGCSGGGRCSWQDDGGREVMVGHGSAPSSSLRHDLTSTDREWEETTP